MKRGDDLRSRSVFWRLLVRSLQRSIGMIHLSSFEQETAGEFARGGKTAQHKTSL